MDDPPKPPSRSPRFTDPLMAKFIELAMGDGVTGLTASLDRFADDARGMVALGDKVDRLVIALGKMDQTMQGAVLALQEHAQALREFTDQFKGSP
jgi:hypothetical protein